VKPWCCLVAMLAACSPEQRAHPLPPREPVPSKALATQDRDFLERAAKAGNAEIATASLVETHALRPEVIALGRMIAADHRAANRELAAIAAAYRIALPDSLGEQQQSFDRVADLHRDAFDREFARIMVDDHHQAIALFRGEAEGGADPRLKAFARATLPRLEIHLEHAKTLASQLEQP
jgi:putative membrane protein